MEIHSQKEGDLRAPHQQADGVPTIQTSAIHSTKPEISCRKPTRIFSEQVIYWTLYSKTFIQLYIFGSFPAPAVILGHIMYGHIKTDLTFHTWRC